MSFLEHLNSQQRKAVEYINGPSLVIAGAGSGKTRVLTYKIAYLLQNGYNPWQIMALTFTNKAAREMKERICNLVGEEYAQRLNMGTFHSLFLKILRREAEKIGFRSNFTIYDETDARSLIKSVVKDLDLDDKTYKPATILSRISRAKNNLVWPEDYQKSEYYKTRDENDGLEQIGNIYRSYQLRLQQSNALDFDDILLYTYKLFAENPIVCDTYGQRYQFILVDEFQDTNDVQQRILQMLVSRHAHICVVGDDAQSIYGFRGANINNILSFQQTFNHIKKTDGTQEDREVKLFKLEQNYRSTANIVNAANSLIEHNSEQIKKTVFTEKQDGNPVRLVHLTTDREEASMVCREIKRMIVKENLSYDDFAILYRNNTQSRTFEEQLRKDNIPYRIVGGLSFYQRKEIKDIIAYFRLVVNHNDEEALRRIINYPTRGIGDTTLSRIQQQAAALGISPWAVISQPEVTGLQVNKGTMNKLHAFTDMITGFASFLNSLDASELGNLIITDSGISADIFKGTDPEDISRQENVKEFIASLRQFVDTQNEDDGQGYQYLTHFLQEVSLLSDIESDDNSSERVQLMTIHSAKGLEFPSVFIVGLEENIIPAQKSAISIRGIEEERRLLYVAITRAEKFCMLSHVSERYHYGNLEINIQPSPFLKDIDRRYLSFGSSLSSIGQQYSSSNRFRSQAGRSFSDYIAKNEKDHPIPSSSRPFANSSPSHLLAGNRRLVSINSQRANDESVKRCHSQSHNSVVKNSGLQSRTDELAVGTVVKHSRFGKGIVLSVEDAGESRKAVIEFEQCGKKQLLLKFARLEIVGAQS